MTPDDRELLHLLRRQQQDLQRSLARLDVQLEELATRLEKPEEPHVLPEIPDDLHDHLPPLPVVEPMELSEPILEPVPPEPMAPPLLPPLPPIPPAPRPSLQSQVGKWLTRIGALFFVLWIVFFGYWADVTYHLHEKLGPWGKLGLMGLVSSLLITLGQRQARKNPKLLIYGRTLAATGLAGLYFTFYAAHYVERLRVIHSDAVGLMLLLCWSIYVFSLAERRRSQLLAFFAIALAYFSTSINPIGTFTMGANLLLAACATLFLLRNGWSSLSYVSLAGTSYAMIRRLIVDETGEISFTTGHGIHFWPHATYVIAAWIIFTAGVLFCTFPSFRGGKRLVFLTLNNGALAGLLPLCAFISGSGFGRMGSTLLDSGIALLVVGLFAGFGRSKLDARELVRAYVTQGLTLFTAGLIVVYAGVSRGVLLMIETFFLGTAAGYSRNIILRIATALVAACATFFLLLQVGFYSHHPWLLGFGGAAVMLSNAWWSRRKVGYDAKARESIVVSSTYYCLLAISLIYTALDTALSDAMLPPVLALAALALTFSIYLVRLYELPPAAQTLLLAAQTLVLFPVESGEALPRWTTAGVAAVTLVMVAWWSRQRVTRSGSWTVVLNLLYSLALAGLAYHAVRPYVNLEGWLISSSLLSVAFLIFGSFTRVWPIAIISQVFLIESVYQFFLPGGSTDCAVLPWTSWAAAVPIAVVFGTGRALHRWIEVFPEIVGTRRDLLRTMAYNYHLLALAMIIRWIAALIPQPDLMATYLFLGTLLLSWNVRHGSTFGVRCSFVLSALGMMLYLHHSEAHARAMATYLNTFAVLSFLTQPAILRHSYKTLVSTVEAWGLIIFSVILGWFFVSDWVETRMNPNYMVVSWALYGVFLFFFGILVSERRLSWCGLGVLAVVFFRVLFFDVWGFPSGFKVLTMGALAIIALGLGFIFARFGDRLKTWL